MTGEHVRRDPHLGTVVHVVAKRQNRPNRPADDCPFCVGGLEAPEPYLTLAFKNRWPALGNDNCEVILYSPDHDSQLSLLGHEAVRAVIDLWAERTDALIAGADVEFVLVFENKGASVGATIDHPHGQIYAFDHVPERQQALFDAQWAPEPDPGRRLIARHGEWQAWVQSAPVHPVSLVIAPSERRSNISSLTSTSRDDLARILIDVLNRCDKMFGAQMPYMMWINQAPKSSPHEWMHIEIVSPWRDTGVARYIAAAEVATGEYFNPVDPEELAFRLNSLEQ